MKEHAALQAWQQRIPVFVLVRLLMLLWLAQTQPVVRLLIGSILGLANRLMFPDYYLHVQYLANIV